MAAVGEDDPVVAPYPHPRLAALEEDNAMLRASCTALQTQLDQVKNTDTVASTVSQDSPATCSAGDQCLQCGQLMEELRTSQSQCEDLKVLQHRLEEQVVAFQSQKDQFETKEKDLNSEIKCLQEKLNQTHITSTALDSGVPSVEKTDTVTDLPLVTVVPEQTQASESHVASDSTTCTPEVLEQCQCRLRELEKENKLLQDQCSAAEVEKTTLRSNIRKITEAEEKLKQKVASLNEQEHEYESLQEEVDGLKEQLEERGQLLHIASSRVTELEVTLKTHETNHEDALERLKQADTQVDELRSALSKVNQEYDVLKKDVETLHVQLADLRFQVSSKDMECDAAVKENQEKTEALSTSALQISEQEARISHLEQQVAADKEVWLHEQERLSAMVDQLQEDGKEKNIQCANIADQLQQAEAKVKMTQNILTDTQSEQKTNHEISSQLSSDNEQLREKVLQLLRQKDALWQANMRLEAAAGGSCTWMENSSAHKCLGCAVSFSLTRRRHHCRSCGRIFCTGCSDNWIMTPASSRRVRVCDDCFSVQAELAAIVATTSTSSWHANDENLGQNSTEAQASGYGRPLPIKQSDDDDYAVISDDEVQSSRLSSSPSSGSASNPDVVLETRATADILTFSSLSSQPPTDFETWVGAGTRSLVPVELPAGVTLQWHFISEPKCVSFSVLHQPPSPPSQPGEEGPASSQRVLIPTTRVASTQGSTVKGRLVTKQPGVYTLVFDNASSRYTAKKITYSLRLLRQTDGDSLSGQPSPSPTSLASP